MPNTNKRMKNHYEKAADELVKSAKELVDFKETPLRKLAWRRSKKLIIQMLKENFIAKNKKWN